VEEDVAHSVPDRTSRRWWPWLALLVVIAAVAVVILLTRDDASEPGPRSSASPSPGATRVTVSRVASYSANLGTTTDTFQAENNWQLRWSAPVGSGFAVELLKEDGTSLGTVVRGGKRSSGTTFVSQSGMFKLKVTSRSPWSIQIFSSKER
jgi:hypothetical protein